MLAGMRILVVDDDSDSREVLAALLAMRGAETKSVSSVREALAVLTEWKPHVLVSDIGLPVEDGYDLIRELRAREARDGGRIPAIALTGYAAAEEGQRALSAGYQMHLGKPIEPNNLVTLIASFGGPNGQDAARFLDT
jgi:CheY-like chemotaxis protein